MKFLFFITFFMSSFLLFSQKPLSKVDSLQKEIRLLDKKLDARDKELIDLKKNQNTVYEKVLDIKENVNKTQKELIKEKFDWYFGVLAVLTSIFGLIIGWLGWRKLVERKANEIFDKFLIERFKEVKEDDITALYNEIESAAWKAQIRAKKILVLNQENTVLPDDFNTALKVFNPEIKSIIEPKNALKIDFSKYSLVVLENYESEGFWNLTDYKDDLIKLTDKVCKEDTAFIYYGDSRKGFYPETTVNKHLVNFANSPSQLYNNVMNTLKFQDLLATS